MKKILFIIVISVSFLSPLICKGEEVTNFQSKHANNTIVLNIYPKVFNTLEEANKIALTLENGQVFKDVDTMTYTIIYGTKVINGVIILSNIGE